MSGEILALANWPTFNPNAFSRSDKEPRRNRAVQDLYEPGSTFKVVTASAALEEGVMHLDEKIDCAPGHISFGSRVISDVHRYGVLSFTDVIVKSSNVGAIKVGLKLGPERLSRYVSRFGFGQTTSPDFRGENPGIVWSPTSLDSSALASVSMGYQVGVTPLQMAAAVSSVANGGTLYEPHIVRALVKDGRRTEVAPKAVRRTITERTAAELTAVMEAVVERGTATAAKIEGYTIAGKTGTAAKIVDGRYSQSDYNASFVGFLPSRKPELTIIVVIDSPRAKGYYGGVVCCANFPANCRCGASASRCSPQHQRASAGADREALSRAGAVDGASGRRNGGRDGPRARESRSDARPPWTQRQRGAAHADAGWHDRSHER